MQEKSESCIVVAYLWVLHEKHGNDKFNRLRPGARTNDFIDLLSPGRSLVGFACIIQQQSLKQQPQIVASASRRSSPCSSFIYIQVCYISICCSWSDLISVSFVDDSSMVWHLKPDLCHHGATFANKGYWWHEVCDTISWLHISLLLFISVVWSNSPCEIEELDRQKRDDDQKNTWFDNLPYF